MNGSIERAPSTIIDRDLNPAPARDRRGGFAWHLLAGVLLVITIVHHPILFSGFRYTQADLLDSRFNNYLLEHSYQWLTCRASFWNPAFCYPEPNLIACSDLMISFAPPYWAARLCGFAPDTAFQIWMLAATAINFLAAYLLLRSGLRFNRESAWTAAILFACAGSRVVQLGHQQLYCQAYVLLALYALLRFSMKRRFGWAVLAAVAVAAQFWGGFYMGFFLTLAIAIGIAWVIVVKRFEHRPFTRRTAVKLALAAMIFAMLVASAASHYGSIARQAKAPDTSVIAAMLPTIKAWFYCGDSSVMYRRLNPFFADLPAPFEQAIGLGLITTIVATIGLWSARRRPLILVVLLTSLSIIMITTRFGETASLWWIIRKVIPGASAIRAVSRIGLLFPIPAALGVAIVLERLRAQRRILIATLVAIVCLAEQMHHAQAYDKFQMRAEVARITNAIPSDAQAFFFTGGDSSHWAMDQVDAMTASMESHIPTINGYSGTWPPAIRTLIMGDMPANNAKLQKLLNEWIAANHLDPRHVAWLVETPTAIVRRSPSTELPSR